MPGAWGGQEAELRLASSQKAGGAVFPWSPCWVWAIFRGRKRIQDGSRLKHIPGRRRLEAGRAVRHLGGGVGSGSLLGDPKVPWAQNPLSPPLSSQKQALPAALGSVSAVAHCAKWPGKPWDAKNQKRRTLHSLFSFWKRIDTQLHGSLDFLPGHFLPDLMETFVLWAEGMHVQCPGGLGRWSDHFPGECIVLAHVMSVIYLEKLRC